MNYVILYIATVYHVSRTLDSDEREVVHIVHCNIASNLQSRIMYHV